MAHPEVELEQLLERVDEIVDAALPRRRPSLGDISAGMVEYEDSTRKGVSGIVLQRIARYDPIIDRVAAEEGVDPNIIRGIIAAETGGRADAQARSGYKGLMQAGRDERQFHPETSIRTGIQTFKKFRDKSLSPRLRALGINLKTVDRETMVRWVMVSYNAGPGTVLKAVEYARASGNVGAWMRPEHFQRALLHTGAYDIATVGRSCLKGRSATEARTLIQKALQERKGLRFKNISLEQARRVASPLLLCALEFKHKHLPGYVNRVLNYMRYYDRNRPARSREAFVY